MFPTKFCFDSKELYVYAIGDKEEFLYNISTCTQLMLQFFWGVTLCLWMSDCSCFRR